MRVITGSLRGRIIPFQGKRSGSVRLTSSMLKEALFASLGPDLEGRSFLDLCAGSGQLGLEAVSRGARVTFNETNKRRFGQIRKTIRQWQISDIDLFCEKAQVLIPRLVEQDRRFEFIYVDPPYYATFSSRPLSLALLDILGETPLLAHGGRLFLQTPRSFELPEESGCLTHVRRRRYGDTTLATYSTD